VRAKYRVSWVARVKYLLNTHVEFEILVFALQPWMKVS